MYKFILFFIYCVILYILLFSLVNFIKYYKKSKQTKDEQLKNDFENIYNFLKSSFLVSVLLFIFANILMLFT